MAPPRHESNRRAGNDRLRQWHDGRSYTPFCRLTGYRMATRSDLEDLMDFFHELEIDAYLLPRRRYKREMNSPCLVVSCNRAVANRVVGVFLAREGRPLDDTRFRAYRGQYGTTIC